MRLTLAFAILLSTISVGAYAEPFLDGRVVAVADGDTLTVLHKRTQVKVRLVDIDAPESKQPFGNRSKQSLSDMCFKKYATVSDQGRDRYGRTLGRVYCDGVDVNEEQVQRGMAWVFVRYAPKNSPLYAIEKQARAAKAGLWADAEPIPPWEWRGGRKK